jgi:hypothetical protein
MNTTGEMKHWKRKEQEIVQNKETKYEQNRNKQIR